MEDHSVPEANMPEIEVPTDPSAPSSKRSAPKKATRRQFSLRYKRDIVEQFARLDRKERGALLRREGLYHSHITKWRRQIKQADRKQTADKTTVSKARYDALKQQLAEVNAQLAQANRIIEVQKKLSELLFTHSRDHADDNSK